MRDAYTEYLGRRTVSMPSNCPAFAQHVIGCSWRAHQRWRQQMTGSQLQWRIKCDGAPQQSQAS